MGKNKRVVFGKEDTGAGDGRVRRVCRWVGWFLGVYLSLECF